MSEPRWETRPFKKEGYKKGRALRRDPHSHTAFVVFRWSEAQMSDPTERRNILIELIADGCKISLIASNMKQSLDGTMLFTRFTKRISNPDFSKVTVLTNGTRAEFFALIARDISLWHRETPP